MTDHDLAQAAKQHFQATTVSYPTWKQKLAAGKYTPKDGSATEWGQAFALLDQIGAAPAPPPPAGGGIGILPLGGTLANVATALQQTSKLVIVSVGDDATTAAKLPGRSLVYMNALKVRVDGGSGVTWQAASSLGYLTAITTPGYPATFAHIDSPAYQQWFAQQAVELARRYGIGGVFLDDVSAYSSGAPYTVSEEKAAMLALTAAVGAAFKAAGLHLLVNANGYEPGVSGSDDGTRDLAWWKQLAPHVNGVMTESWQQARDGSLTLRLRGSDDYRKRWDEWQAAAAGFAQAFPDVDFVGLSYGNDAVLTYCRASILLVHPAGIFIGHRDGDSDPAGAWMNGSIPHVDPVVGTASIS